MKILLLRNNLLEALNSVDKAVEPTASLPILKNISLKAEKGNKIVFISTNLELAIEYTTSGKVIKDGTAVVPFDVLISIVRNLASEKISIEQKDQRLTVGADNYEATINCENPKEFPIIPTIQNTRKVLKLKEKDLTESLSKAVVATQYSEIRPEINGILFNYDSQLLTLVGTDSFRLVEKFLEQGKVQSTLEDGTNLIIPLKAVESALKIFGEDGEIEIFADPNQVLFKTEQVSLISRLVDGAFPDYKTVIPKESQREILVDRRELVNAVKVAKTFAGRANDVTFSFGDNKKVLEVSSRDSVLGENTYKVPIKTKGKQDPLSIAFNWRYVFDGLRIYRGESVLLGISGAEHPVLIRSAEEKELTYVVMPIRS